jgi:hypothetical protein
LDFGQRNGNVTAARVEEKQDRDSMYCKLKVTSYDDDKFESRMQGATDTGVMMMRKKHQEKRCNGWNMSLKTSFVGWARIRGQR